MLKPIINIRFLLSLCVVFFQQSCRFGSVIRLVPVPSISRMAPHLPSPKPALVRLVVVRRGWVSRIVSTCLDHDGRVDEIEHEIIMGIIEY